MSPFAVDKIKPGQALPADAEIAEIAELITMLVRFRTQAVATVTATLASSIESNIELLASRILADYLERSPKPEAGAGAPLDELSARRRKAN